MRIKVTFGVLLAIMILMNALNVRYRSPVLLNISFVAAALAIGVDIYRTPTRKKIVTYMIAAVLLVLLYIALDQGWITAMILI
jgi:hypothetical protein